MQVAAVTALAQGATVTAAAEAAGVHRTTVFRWAKYHPAFIAERNRQIEERAIEVRTKMERITNSALDVVAEAVLAANVDVAFRWLRIVSPTSLFDVQVGPTNAGDVIDEKRRATPDPLLALLESANTPTVTETETRLAELLADEAAPARTQRCPACVPPGPSGPEMPNQPTTAAAASPGRVAR